MKQRIQKPLYEVGDRVRVVAEHAPECLTGYVTKVMSHVQGRHGYLVVPHRGEGSRGEGFGWDEHELRLAPSDLRIVRQHIASNFPLLVETSQEAMDKVETVVKIDIVEFARAFVDRVGLQAIREKVARLLPAEEDE